MRHINNLYWKYIGCQKQFDEELRRREKSYNRGKIIEIDEIQTNNLREFWKEIKSLAPEKNRTIPMKVYTNGGGVSPDVQTFFTTGKIISHNCTINLMRPFCLITLMQTY